MFHQTLFMQGMSGNVFFRQNLQFVFCKPVGSKHGHTTRKSHRVAQRSGEAKKGRTIRQQICCLRQSAASNAPNRLNVLQETQIKTPFVNRWMKRNSRLKSTCSSFGFQRDNERYFLLAFESFVSLLIENINGNYELDRVITPSGKHQLQTPCTSFVQRK